MQIFGWLSFVVGAIMLILFGFFEVNIPGLIFGMAALVSGSIFAAAGYVVEELRRPVETTKSPTKNEDDSSKT